jgi:hypothetical protein
MFPPAPSVPVTRNTGCDPWSLTSGMQLEECFSGWIISQVYVAVNEVGLNI